jgi:hypothetical protein
MRVALLLSVLLVVAFAFTVTEANGQSMPMMRTVEPYSAKVGAEVVATGDNLGKEMVAEVFIGVDGNNTKVEVTSQAEKELKFKVPTVKAGPYRVIVLTKGANPVMIEEPVRLVVEE